MLCIRFVVRSKAAVAIWTLNDSVCPSVFHVRLRHSTIQVHILSSAMRGKMAAIEREYEAITNNLHRVLIADSAGKGAGDKSAGDLLTVMPDLLQTALKRVQVWMSFSYGFSVGVAKIALLQRVFCVRLTSIMIETGQACGSK
jgi:hypothetical protein